MKNYQVFNTLNKYGLTENQIFLITSDNAQNMLKMSDLLAENTDNDEMFNKLITKSLFYSKLNIIISNDSWIKNVYLVEKLYIM